MGFKREYFFTALVIICILPGRLQAAEKDSVYFHLLEDTVTTTFAPPKTLVDIFVSELKNKPGIALIETSATANRNPHNSYSAITAAELGKKTGVKLVVLGDFASRGPYVRITFGLFDVEKKKKIHEVNNYILGHDSGEMSDMVRKLGKEFITGDKEFKLPGFVVWTAVIGAAGVAGFYTAIYTVLDKEKTSNRINVNLSW